MAAKRLRKSPAVGRKGADLSFSQAMFLLDTIGLKPEGTIYIQAVGKFFSHGGLSSQFRGSFPHVLLLDLSKINRAGFPLSENEVINEYGGCWNARMDPLVWD